MGALFLGFVLSVFSLFLLLINSILFVSKVKKINNSTYSYVATYLVILFIVELFCNTIGYLYPGQNFYLSHFYFNAQFILLSIVFYRLFKSQKLKKLVILNYVIVTLILLGMYIYNNELFWQFNLFEIAMTSVLLIIYALIHLSNTMGTKKKYFYLSVGMILYLLCSSLIFLFGNYELVFIEDPYIDIWIFNTLFYIVYQVFIFVEWNYINKNGLDD
ncbi:hypothetical protein DS884_05395 [Tenacibaculum sp. E3R01]|uniref:hypothetical protein n=1 Tax=Tenacibaculum sp. E3R01 TaxID=2267227 RepID=UPI000DEB3CF7|nr:hypothetical protein [Tenacibaculum sp. E3R01]RBW59183.1 hypothetical protein DS884_05395 [Tenacibaculum sp. E3R01]